MEVKIFSVDNKEVGKKKLPAQFSEVVRPDLIKRAVLSIQGNKRQQYGADPRAGKKAAARLSRRRRDYKGAYGKGLSRMPRKTMTRRGMQMIFVGAFAPGTVGGRRAHPPVSSHIFAQKINDKERRKAIRSALSAVFDKELVVQRGHKTPASYPFVVSNDAEALDKTQKIVDMFEKLGLKDELARSSVRRVRAGKGKMRGRRYKHVSGPLLVVSSRCKAEIAAKNVPGVDVVEVSHLNAELLAPGAMPGRLTIFTQGAVEKLEKERLFL